MGRINWPGGDNVLDELYRRLHDLETSSWLENASASRGTTKFLGNESLKVIGSAVVSGWLIITGTLKLVGSLVMEGILTATGTTNLNGPVNIAGTQTTTGILNQNGPWNLSGAGGITGDVASTGTWTQTGTYRVTGGGKIIIDGTDPMSLGVTSPGGRPGVQFSNSARLVGTADGIQLVNPGGNGLIYAGDTVGMQRGSKSINITAAGITADAPFKISSLPIAPAGTTVFMVVADAAGNLMRKSTAA